jgi:TolB-like protein
MGTVGYMSPEQVRGLAVDHRSDLFSFGAILYEMLSGKRAFQRDTVGDTMAAILKEEPPELSDFGRNISPALDHIVRHCLEKDRDNRFQTAKDVAFALSEASGSAQSAGSIPKRSGVVPIAAAVAVLLLLAGVLIPRLTRRAPPPAAEASIAVLPFQNLGADKEQEYFADGLSEELMGLLVKVKQLRVAGRTSSFSFRGKTDDLASIGLKLHVATVLEGSVRRSGERLRVSTRLVNVADGYQMWAETYDRKMTDVFAVQDEIARAVVAALRLKLLPLERPPSSEQRTSNPEAYNQYLLGRYLLNGLNTDSVQRAVEALDKAISLDASFAPAYAHLAIAELRHSDDEDTPEGLSEDRRKAFAAADKAIALDPEMADGYSARGYLRCWVSWDWAGAKSDFDRTLSLEPGNPGGHGRYANLLASLGRLPEAIAELERAIEIDPLSTLGWTRLARYLCSSGRLAEARKALRTPLEIEPEGSGAQWELGMISLLEHKPQIALAEFSRNHADPGFRLTGIAVAENDLGHAAQSQRALDELISKYAHSSAFQVAQVYAWRREPDKAFEWLNRAYAQRDTGIAELTYDVFIARVRDDPRYGAMLKKLNLPLGK